MSMFVHFSGRLAKDSRFNLVETTEGKKPKLGFTVAVDEGFGERKKTLWPECELWAKNAEKLSTMLLKGTKVTVTGIIKEIRQNQKDGKNYVSLVVLVTDSYRGIELHGSKHDNGASEPAPVAAPAPASPAPAFNDDIPF